MLVEEQESEMERLPNLSKANLIFLSERYAHQIRKQDTQLFSYLRLLHNQVHLLHKILVKVNPNALKSIHCTVREDICSREREKENECEREL